MLELSQLVRLEEARQAQGVAAVADEAVPFAGGFLCFGGLGSWASTALGCCLTDPPPNRPGKPGLKPDERAELVSYFERRGAVPTIVVPADGLPGSQLAAGLVAEGFVVASSIEIWARAVAPGDALIEPTLPAGYAIEVVDPVDPVAVDEQIAAANRGFFARGETIDRHTFRIGRRMVADPRVVSLVVRHGGKAVAGASIERFDPIAALITASVDEQHRRQGLQRALIDWRIAHAARTGIRVVTMGSTPGTTTARNATRAGFTFAYRRLVWHRPAPGLVPADV
jgi:GNAT superfamily N-acetyltransferase